MRIGHYDIGCLPRKYEKKEWHIGAWLQIDWKHSIILTLRLFLFKWGLMIAVIDFKKPSRWA